MWNPRVITTDAVQNFLEKGGKLDYRPIHTPKGWNWELWAVQTNGTASPVISSKTGEAASSSLPTRWSASTCASSPIRKGFGCLPRNLDKTKTPSDRLDAAVGLIFRSLRGALLSLSILSAFTMGSPRLAQAEPMNATAFRAIAENCAPGVAPPSWKSWFRPRVASTRSPSA